MTDFDDRSGPRRVGTAPHIYGRSNDPTRVSTPGLVRTLQVSPWDVAPIPTAQNFFRQERANLALPAAAGSTVVTTVAGGGALQIPANNIASIQAVVLFCDAPALTTSITYTVRASGVPVDGLTNLKFPPQAAGFINFPLPGPYNVYRPGAFIDVLITRIVADVINQVNFTLVGWFNSSQDVMRWTGQVPGQLSS